MAEMHKNRDEVHAENWLALALGLRNAGKLKERLLCCVQDKSNKIRNNRDIEEFSQWWLLLADYVEYGISDVDCEELTKTFGQKLLSYILVD